MLERQNVNVSLKIFDTSTLAALSIYNSKRTDSDSRRTCEFLNIIINVSKIFNVNITHKHFRLNDQLSKPSRYNDERLNFLRLIINWLARWRSREGKHGKLSPQTLQTFRIHALR